MMVIFYLTIVCQIFLAVVLILCVQYWQILMSFSRTSISKTCAFGTFGLFPLLLMS